MAFNGGEFLSALDSIEQLKGIDKETVLNALKEAMIKGYKKELGGDDADVRVNIDPEHNILELFNVKRIVKEVEDDFLEISLEDAKKVNKDYKVGDEFFIPASVDDFKKTTASSIKSIMKQKFAEAERGILYDQFKDKINTMITGKIEKIDERGCSVNIGRTSVYLPRKEMIKDEKFNAGDTIKLFISDVASGTKGAHIVVSRANAGFLRCLMTEEIHEIYDGTITIKSVAREAGERSKVAVFTNDINVDPAGACIGPNGSRIQKVVSQLGNSSAKEKIDIIAYSDNVALYLMEALKPARVVGIIFNSEEEKKATIIVKDDSLSLAIGKKGVNVRLAAQLTNYGIDIKTESDALSEGLSYTSLEEIQAQEIEERAKKALEAQKEAYFAAAAASKVDVLPGLPEGYVAPQARKYEDENVNDFDVVLEEEAENDDAVTVTPVVTPVNEEVKPVEVAPVVEEKTTEVKTTTTLEDLEKSLEASQNKDKKNFSKGKFKKNKDEEEIETVNKSADPSTYMAIYTDEELKAMEEEDKEDKNEEEEDIDYDDYDDYYDEK